MNISRLKLNVTALSASSSQWRTGRAVSFIIKPEAAGGFSGLGGLLLVLLLFVNITATAQHVKEVSADYTYVTTADMSVSEAKRVALERARIQALANEFGTTVSQTNTTQINNSSGGKSSLDFLSLGSSEIKGEWLQDTRQPEYEIKFDGDNLIVHVTVSGKAREIVSASVDVAATILRNGKERKFESDEFRDGDDLYLLFKSPVAGFVAVYLVDDAKTAYCLLPYSGDTDGQQPVEAGREYLFFDTDKACDAALAAITDELTMTCSKAMEHNEIYIIFSATPFVKAQDDRADERLPRSLSADDFRRWLTKNRVKDKDMVVINRLIKVTKG